MDTRRGRGDKPLLGEILLERGLIRKESLDRGLRVQAGGLRRLGYLLVKMGFIREQQLLDAVSSQLGLPLVRVDDEFSTEARGLLPRHLCRRFTVLPLALEGNNVVRLAMADPLDDVAIREVENFTGLAVLPVLASVNDIQQAVGRRVARSRHDLFNPEVYRLVAKISAAVAVILLCVAGFLVYRELQRQKYGTVSRVGDSLIFKNHDLMVDVAADGTVYFSGRGAFAESYYGIRFDGQKGLSAFLATQEPLLSVSQREWLEWVLTRSPARESAGPARRP